MRVVYKKTENKMKCKEMHSSNYNCKQNQCNVIQNANGMNSYGAKVCVVFFCFLNINAMQTRIGN